MADSLMTFTPNGGSAINLGNQDCWVKVESDQFVETYTVHGYYLRNDPADPKDGTTPAAVRTAAEVYFKTLVQSLGITKADTQEFAGVEYVVPRIGAVHGVLANPYTSLSVSGLYLVDAEHEDDGWRGFDFTLTFVKQVTLASPGTATFDPTGATPATPIGSNVSYIVKTEDPQVVTWTVMSSYTAINRAAAESYAASLANLFTPRPLLTIDTPTGPQFVPHALAVSGTLANSVTALSEAGVYCVSLTHDDQGSLTYGITAVFQRSTYAPVTDTAADTRVAKYKTIAIGNRPASIHVSVDEPAVLQVVVRSLYVGADAPTYADTLATAIALEPVFVATIPRGSAGNKAALRSYTAVSGTLTCSAVLGADITTLHAIALRVQPTSDPNTVAVELTLNKSR